MINILGKALSGLVLDRDARDAMNEMGGLALTIQGSADMRMVLREIAANRAAIGATSLLASPATYPGAMSNEKALHAALVAQILASARAQAAAADAAAAAPPRIASTQLADPTLGAGTGINSSLIAQALAAAQAVLANGGNAANQPASRQARGPSTAPSAERAALIRNALKVHAAKQNVLANLSDEQRAKLADLAIKLLGPKTAGQA